MLLYALLLWILQFDVNQSSKSKCKLSDNDIVELLDLAPLPDEGGFFYETYKSETIVNVNGINQTASTQIYYMITEESFSALHKLTKDEVWHFYLGDPAELLLIYDDGQHEIITLGNDIMNGEILQFVVSQGIWFGVKLQNKGTSRVRRGNAQKLKCGYALFGTTVAPGFEFSDFTLGPRDELIDQFPDLQHLITEYTHS